MCSNVQRCLDLPAHKCVCEFMCLLVARHKKTNRARKEEIKLARTFFCSFLYNCVAQVGVAVGLVVKVCACTVGWVPVRLSSNAYLEAHVYMCIYQ